MGLVHAGGRVWVAGSLGVAGVAACSLFTSYDGLTGGTGNDASTRDAPVPIEAQVPTGADCGLAPCGVAVPSGWSLVAFAASADASCAPGLATLDLVESPDASRACSCGTCAITQAPSCDTGTIEVLFGETPGSCAVPAYSFPVSKTCASMGAQSVAGYVEIVAPSSTGGACTSPGIGDAAAVTGTIDRACVPMASTCAALCAPGPGFASCLQASGDRSCPAGFPNKHLAGTNAPVCPDCACSVQGVCTGTLTFFTDQACMQGALSLVAGQCVVENNGPSYVSSEWTGAVADASCAAQPSDAGASLGGSTTICCP